MKIAVLFAYFSVTLPSYETYRSPVLSWVRASGPEKYIAEQLNEFFTKAGDKNKLIFPKSSYVVKKSSIRMNVTLDGRTFVECGDGFSFLPQSAKPGPRKSRIVTLKRRKRSLVASPIYVYNLSFFLRKCEPIERKIVHWRAEEGAVKTLNEHNTGRITPACNSSSVHFENFFKIDEYDNLVCSSEFPDPIKGSLEVTIPKLRIMVRFSLNNPGSDAEERECVNSFSNVRVRQRHFDGLINQKSLYYLPRFDTLFKALEGRLEDILTRQIDASKLCQTIDPKIRWPEI